MNKEQAYAMIKGVIDSIKLTAQERDTLMAALNKLVEQEQ